MRGFKKFITIPLAAILLAVISTNHITITAKAITDCYEYVHETNGVYSGMPGINTFSHSDTSPTHIGYYSCSNPHIVSESY